MPNNMNSAPEFSPENVENLGNRGEQTAEVFSETETEKRINELDEKKKELREEQEKVRAELSQLEVELYGNATEIETVSSETAQEIERGKKNTGLKKFLNNKAKMALVGVLAGLMLLGGIIVADHYKNNRATDVNPQTGYFQQVDTPTDPDDLSLDGYTGTKNEIDEEKGIYDGYGEIGMWESDGKITDYAFGDASKVAEICDNDSVEIIKYFERNQVESFADYLANLPKELQPDGFKGLTILETEKKLESLSDDEYEEVQKHFEDVMDQAFTRRVVLNGRYENSFMRKIDANGPTTHENMELVKCYSYENGREYEQFFWQDEDGNEIGTMTVKLAPVYDNEGNIVGYTLCTQVLNKAGDPVYEGLDEVQSDEKKDTGEEGGDDKVVVIEEGGGEPVYYLDWGKFGNPRSGDLRDQSEKVKPESEVTRGESEGANTGNQGDAEVAPGSGSEGSGLNSETGFAESGIIAEGADKEGDRLEGGDKQDTETAGENYFATYTSEDEDFDEEGDKAQDDAEGEPGEDNHSNRGEERIVREGDF